MSKTNRYYYETLYRYFTIEQKLDYAKLMVNENYINKKIMAISSLSSSALNHTSSTSSGGTSGRTADRLTNSRTLSLAL
jgi:hypothetical protein